ncbi:MAG: YggT family protein [Planctomycetota bacterium]
MREIIGGTLFLYQLIVLARVIFSWMQLSPYENSLARFVYTMTEPVLAKIRSVVPPLGGMIDLSPMILLFGLHILYRLFMPSVF